MQVEITHIDGVSVLRLLETRIDAARAADFRKLFSSLHEDQHDRIAIDFGKVNFLDSSGLGALVSGLKLIGNKGEIVLFGVTGLVENLFKLTRMNRVCIIADNEADAIAKLKS